MMTMKTENKEITVRDLYEDIVLLICESRHDVSPATNRLVNGPHCPPVRPTQAGDPTAHYCDPRNQLCQQAFDHRRRATRFSQKQLPLSVCVCLAPKCCESSGMLLEKWTVSVTSNRNTPSTTVHPTLLLHAVRSHLAFSQYSAWLMAHKGDINCRTVYRVSLPGEHDSQITSSIDDNFHKSDLEKHVFPESRLSCGSVISVALESLPRQSQPPPVGCVCHLVTKPPTNLSLSKQPPSQPTAAKKLIGQSMANWKTYSTLDSIPVVSASTHNTSGSSESSVGLANPLFGLNSISGASLGNQEQTNRMFHTPTKTSDTNSSHQLPLDDSHNVQFYIESPKSADKPLPGEIELDQGKEHQKFDIQTQTSSRSISNNNRNASKKILFSSDASKYQMAEDRTDAMLAELRLDQCDSDASTSSVPTRRPQSRSNPTTTTKVTRRLPFSSIGLPLTSSPAPLKRNKYSFDYDATLNTVAGLKSVFYHEHYDSGSSDSEIDTGPLCKSAPASTNLLGNFEESALNGRIKPNGLLDGFSLELAASGAFCPAHVILPVRTSFFNVSHDDAPSPYLGHCHLQPPILSKKGYHVPRKGTVQATLFNPNETVVKMFVVRYDLSDMPVHSQTFVRQRTFYMPRRASIQDARAHPHWLRYLIHLRFATSRSGRLYIHTDIRMLFSRKSELESFNRHEMPTSSFASSTSTTTRSPSTNFSQSINQSSISQSTTSQSSSVKTIGASSGYRASHSQSFSDCQSVSHLTVQSVDDGQYDLRSFTEMPRNPKYSPRKGEWSYATGCEDACD